MRTPVDEKEAARVMWERVSAATSDPAKAPQLDGRAPAEDGLAALAMIRARATEWKVDPDRVGMIGFSAGAMTALSSVLQA